MRFKGKFENQFDAELKTFVIDLKNIQIGRNIKIVLSMNNLANYLMLLLHVVTGTVVSDILVRNHFFTYWRDIVYISYRDGPKSHRRRH